MKLSSFQKSLLLIFLAILLVALALICWHFWPDILNMLEAHEINEHVEKLSKYVQELTQKMGFFGPVFVIFMNVAQIVIAVIPGEPIELASGVLYGWFFGTILGIIGVLIGETIAFMLTKRYGIRLVNKLFHTDVQKIKLLQNSDRLELLTFLLFLIPGTPKDLITYLIGLSPMRLSTFLFLSVIARIPSLLSSAVIGGSAISGNFKLTFWCFILSLALGLIGIAFKDPLLNWAHRKEARIHSGITSVVSDLDEKKEAFKENRENRKHK